MATSTEPTTHPGETRVARIPYGDKLDCGCSLRDGFCPTHQSMMATIHQAWQAGRNPQMLAIWEHSDGYGEPGFVPEQGYDWSGIRDSSTTAIEAMYAVAQEQLSPKSCVCFDLGATGHRQRHTLCPAPHGDPS